MKKNLIVALILPSHRQNPETFIIEVGVEEIFDINLLIILLIGSMYYKGWKGNIQQKDLKQFKQTLGRFGLILQLGFLLAYPTS